MQYNTGAKSNIYEISVSTTDESKPVINSVEVSDMTTNSFTLIINASSDVKISKYYFIIDEYNISGVSSTNMYKFQNLERDVVYKVGVYAKDEMGIISSEYQINVKIPSIKNYCKNGNKLSECIKLYYENSHEGYDGLYYHDGSGIYINANLETGDNSYRYAGANPNNYICFGSDSTACANDNLYRMIGVFGNETKIIRVNSDSSRWCGTTNSNGCNKWSSSNINSTLNSTFYNSFDNKYRNMITNHLWEVGGFPFPDNNDFPKTTFNEEIINNNVTYSSKIGLMYISDYLYASSPTNWSKTINYGGYNSSENTLNNWLFLGEHEWTIEGRKEHDKSAIIIYNTGYITSNISYSPMEYRPCFYLKSDVTYVSGDGSINSPIIIDCPTCTAD